MIELQRSKGLTEEFFELTRMGVHHEYHARGLSEEGYTKHDGACRKKSGVAVGFETCCGNAMANPGLRRKNECLGCTEYCSAVAHLLEVLDL